MTAHGWMPKSQCDASCVDAGDGAATPWTIVSRVTRLAALLATFPAVNTMTPRRWRDQMQRGYARKTLRCFGIELRVVDSRGTADADPQFAQPGSGALIAAGHVGWTDVLVLAAVQPVSFVARGDLTEWPFMGRLATLMRVIPIDRASLRRLPAVVGEVSARVAAGERVAVFPEATTWCGRAYGGLRPAIFQAAVDTGTPVQPVRLRYLSHTGVLTTQSSFVGAESLVGSITRLLRAQGMTAEVLLAPPLAPGNSRRDLARRCESAIRGEVRFDFTAHGTGAEPVLRPTHTERVLRRVS